MRKLILIVALVLLATSGGFGEEWCKNQKHKGFTVRKASNLCWKSLGVEWNEKERKWLLTEIYEMKFTCIECGKLIDVDNIKRALLEAK